MNNLTDDIQNEIIKDKDKFKYYLNQILNASDINKYDD